MKILCVDIGTGTQDIFLYDSKLDVENGFKLVVPSPTMVAFHAIKKATKSRQSIVLTGGLMGGGPNQWATERHLQKGLCVFATPEAASSFNDDLNFVKNMGVVLLSEDEANQLPDEVKRIPFRDFDFRSIWNTFNDFGVDLSDLAAVAVGVFDHGDAPPGISDRQYRFDYLDSRIREKNSLTAFAYLASDVPGPLTRFKSIIKNAGTMDLPFILMDTAPAAILGAMLDSRVIPKPNLIVINIGNLHTLAFRMENHLIRGVFEHHTGMLDRERLDDLLDRLVKGTLQHEQVFDHHGHGALLYTNSVLKLPEDDFGVVVVGPRRNIMQSSQFHPYFAVPFGDMMIAGCYGMLMAVAELIPKFKEPIHQSLLDPSDAGRAPWEDET